MNPRKEAVKDSPFTGGDGPCFLSLFSFMSIFLPNPVSPPKWEDNSSQAKFKERENIFLRPRADCKIVFILLNKP